MMPSLSKAFDVSVAQVGYLISLYAIGMVIGGPLLTVGLLKLRVFNKKAMPLAISEQKIQFAVSSRVFHVCQPDRTAAIDVTRNRNSKSSVPVYVAVAEIGKSISGSCFSVSW